MTRTHEDISERFEMWLRSTSRSDSTIMLRLRYVRALSHRFPLLHVRRRHLEELLAEKRHLAPETRKSMLASWRLFYGWAVDRGHVKKDPTRKLESVRIPVRVPRLASDVAVMRAIDHATPEQRAMILLARYACLRLSELTKLRTRDRTGDALRIRGKGDKERVVHVNDELLFALRALERDGRSHYFPGRRGEHMHPQSVNKIITRISGCNPHSLRHAGATAAYAATKDLRGVQLMLGHASMATTQRYLHADAEALRAVAAATTIRRDRLAA